MIPVVTVDEGAVTVTYPDGMSWTWPKDSAAHELPYLHVCAPTTCGEHDVRFWRAWKCMADVRRAERAKR